MEIHRKHYAYCIFINYKKLTISIIFYEMKLNIPGQFIVISSTNLPFRFSGILTGIS